MVIKILFRNQYIYIRLNADNLLNYQMFFLRDTQEEIRGYSLHECAYELFLFLKTKLDNVCFIEVLEHSNIPDLTGLFAIDFEIKQIYLAKIYLSPNVRDKVAYLLELENYIRLPSIITEDNYYCELSSGVDPSSRLSLDLIHGVVNISPSEFMSLGVGDVLLFEESFAPESVRVNLGLTCLIFKINNNQIVLREKIYKSIT